MGQIKSSTWRKRLNDRQKAISVGAYVADTNARGQLMLILGTMHNFEEYAIVIQKNDGAIFKNQLWYNFDGIQIVRWILFYETDTYY